MRYKITNNKTDDSYIKEFNNDDDVYHWIVNHLDLSLYWSYNRLEDIKIVSTIEEKRDIKGTIEGVEDSLLDIYEEMNKKNLSFVDIEIIIKKV